MRIHDFTPSLRTFNQEERDGIFLISWLTSYPDDKLRYHTKAKRFYYLAEGVPAESWTRLPTADIEATIQDYRHLEPEDIVDWDYVLTRLEVLP